MTRCRAPAGFGDAYGLGRELGRSQVARWCVGEVPGEEYGASEPLDAAAIGTVGPDECGGRGLFRAVASKGISRKRPAESQSRRIGAVGRGLEPVAPFRERIR